MQRNWHWSASPQLYQITRVSAVQFVDCCFLSRSLWWLSSLAFSHFFSLACRSANLVTLFWFRFFCVCPWVILRIVCGYDEDHMQTILFSTSQFSQSCDKTVFKLLINSSGWLLPSASFNNFSDSKQIQQHHELNTVRLSWWDQVSWMRYASLQDCAEILRSILSLEIFKKKSSCHWFMLAATCAWPCIQTASRHVLGVNSGEEATYVL